MSSSFVQLVIHETPFRNLNSVQIFQILSTLWNTQHRNSAQHRKSHMTSLNILLLLFYSLRNALESLISGTYE